MDFMLQALLPLILSQAIQAVDVASSSSSAMPPADPRCLNKKPSYCCWNFHLDELPDAEYYGLGILGRRVNEFWTYSALNVEILLPPDRPVQRMRFDCSYVRLQRVFDPEARWVRAPPVFPYDEEALAMIDRATIRGVELECTPPHYVASMEEHDRVGRIGACFHMLPEHLEPAMKAGPKIQPVSQLAIEESEWYPMPRHPDDHAIDPDLFETDAALQAYKPPRTETVACRDLVGRLDGELNYLFAEDPAVLDTFPDSSGSDYSD